MPLRLTTGKPSRPLASGGVVSNELAQFALYQTYAVDQKIQGSLGTLLRRGQFDQRSFQAAAPLLDPP